MIHALEQIKTRGYLEELRAYKVHNIVAVGVAVEGKKILVATEVV